jgi:hypothetical protein
LTTDVSPFKSDFPKRYPVLSKTSSTMSITASFCQFSDSGEVIPNLSPHLHLARSLLPPQSTETSIGTILRDLDLSPRPTQLVSTPHSFSSSSRDPSAASVSNDRVNLPSPAARVGSRLSSPVAPRLDVEWPNSPPLTLSLKMSGVFDHVDLSLPVEGDVTAETHRSESPGFDMTYDVQVSIDWQSLE